jgi:hypothetical protein
MTDVPDRSARLVTGRVPVMRETTYDLTSAMGIAASLVLIGGVILLISIWASSFLPENYTPGVQMIVSDGGTDDGAPDDSLDVESPEDLSDDPSLANDQQETQLEQTLETMVSATGAVSTLNFSNELADDTSSGLPGSATGTGGQPLGAVKRGRRGGVPPEQRWIVEFAEGRSLELYAAQLDHFGIELTAVLPDGRVFYVRNLSSGFETREGRIDGGDQRLFMNWKGGGQRVEADRDLLGKAGVPDVGSAVVLHFYPAETEQLLAQAEADYASRPIEQVRRTNFRVAGEPGSFRFVVEAQKYR